MSATPSAGLWGMKMACARELAPMSLSVSKYCVMSSNSEMLSVLSFSPVSTLMEFLRPSTMAARCFAMPSPCKRAASASASALTTVLIFSASAAMTAASRNRFCLLISFIECMTSWLGLSSVTKAWWIMKPKSAMCLPSCSCMATEIESLFSKASSSIIFGTWDRTTSATYESTCALTSANLYTAASTRSGITDCWTATLATTKTLSLVLVSMYNSFCSTRREIERRPMQMPQQSQPRQLSPAPMILSNSPKRSTA
mmetsp:Transcript_3294/g.7642  ORF Transcript_3294/g.7642 Transcript_3294/m.7642 type:complete len:256 (-) Transcript_3294:250-1017(-)